MKIVNVNELHTALGKLIEAGQGKKLCFVTTDEEGNDYRPLWDELMYADPKNVKDIMQYSCSGLSGLNPNNIVMVG